MLVEVIRKWYPTICYELALPLLPIRIETVQPSHSPYGHDLALGHYNKLTCSITMFVLTAKRPRGLRGSYLRTLAHELRHAWQHYNDKGFTEGDANDWTDKDFLMRYASGPTAGRYGGPIEGESYPCSTCGRRIRDGRQCFPCQSAAREAAVQAEARERALIERQRLEAWEARRAGFSDAIQSAGRGFRSILTWPARRLRQRRELRELSYRQAVLSYKIEYIDKHPSNGCFGWWRVDGQYSVQAGSAAEAVMRVAHDLATETPSIEYFGETPPFKTKTP